MRENARYSWRETLEEGKYQEGGEVEEKKEKKGEEEHPFVEVLPAEKDPNASEKPKKKEKKEVKEGLRLSLNPNTQFLEAKELSIDDQMRISREHNRKSAEEKKAANKAAMGDVKKVEPKKDTRTSAQKMADATDERPGSFYRNMKR